ncbi:NADH dehydrogenase subunit 5 (mitochondrion) [Trypanosoma rangeli SC58]|uniref:NADH dehydrogenase subunit 5 n=2 Tax=Trypanosoma rangeli TaxID=5698 RepID=A0A088DJJ5_TRYRA|nr:NADH dehydrogenase subunit 5 [Trypanosoma rangeli]ESL04768.1 NADH dehydrogenase subunit 5 [Trypanosoma rangeli SC58]
MFLFLMAIFFIFGLTSGTLLLGRHFMSIWGSVLITIFIFLSVLFSFIIVGVCLYGYCYYDFCIILMLDFCFIWLTFSCTGFYMFILLLINIVFCFILFYAFYYMYFDIYLGRFFNIFWLFIMCMNFFILSYDFLTAYCGWELLGLYSFFLISYFWYRFFSLKFGFKAFFIGKIGDILLMSAFSIIFLMNGFCVITFQFLNNMCIDYYYITFALFLLISCAFTKSTQFGLHIWLPDAMEGPIPVSALIHAATLVVCGIILISFTYWCFEFWFSYFYTILVWATLIIVLMSMCVFYNFDAKRYIAFSTICQISFSLFCCICLDLYVGCLFFCYHIFYKASLFIVIGVWIHFFFGLQDLRCYFFMYFCGCILARLLLIFAILNSCSIWFLCGFYCKDLLLCMLLLVSFYNIIEFLFICIIFIFFTVIYNYFILFFLFFVFKCFCLVDCLFLLFDFECCLIYCMLCVYMCFISIFFVLDFLFTFANTSYCIFWAFFLYFYSFFDITIFVLFIIIMSSFIYYGCMFFYFFNVDCIMLFWRGLLIITTLYVFSIFCCWYFVCFMTYSSMLIWNFVIQFRYNLKYCLFFCILWMLYV